LNQAASSSRVSPSCGSKETVIVRLLAQRELRLKLARFTDNPEELAISYRRESLRDMCRKAGIWRSGNKRFRQASSIGAICAEHEDRRF
jgi:hypothetical protein